MCKKQFSLFSFFSGIVIGIVGGLLFAPTKGVNTRKVLGYKLRRYAEKLQDLIKVLSKTRVSTSSEAKAAGKEIIDQTIDKAQQLLKDANELATQL